MTYRVEASGSNGADSAEDGPVWVFGPIPPDNTPPDPLFWFRLTNPDSFARQCFTEQVAGKDADDAKKKAEANNPGYTALKIDANDQATACNVTKFWFKMTNSQNALRPCYTTSTESIDETMAKQRVEHDPINKGYQAARINEADVPTACD